MAVIDVGFRFVLLQLMHVFALPVCRNFGAVGIIRLVVGFDMVM